MKVKNPWPVPAGHGTQVLISRGTSEVQNTCEQWGIRCENLKLKCMRLRPSHFSSGVTGEEEQERPAMVVRPSQPGLLMDGLAAMLRKSWEFYQHKILIALVFFVLKFAWFLIKDSNLSLY